MKFEIFGTQKTEKQPPSFEPKFTQSRNGEYPKPTHYAQLNKNSINNEIYELNNL